MVCSAVFTCISMLSCGRRKLHTSINNTTIAIGFMFIGDDPLSIPIFFVPKMISCIWGVRLVSQDITAAQRYFTVMRFCHTFYQLLGSEILRLAVLQFISYFD